MPGRLPSPGRTIAPLIASAALHPRTGHWGCHSSLGRSLSGRLYGNPCLPTLGALVGRSASGAADPVVSASAAVGDVGLIAGHCLTSFHGPHRGPATDYVGNVLCRFQRGRAAFYEFSARTANDGTRGADSLPA